LDKAFYFEQLYPLQDEALALLAGLDTGLYLTGIELVNDVPSHIGAVHRHPVLGHLDSPENILANKISALVDRREPKDLADIWGFCCRMGLSLETALEDVHSKAAGIFPLDVARLLCTATADDWRLIRWIETPAEKAFLADLQALGEQLLVE
jgi:hypothetical protein